MNAVMAVIDRLSDAAAGRRDRIARAFARSAGTYDKHASLQRQVADRLLQGLPASVGPLPVLDLGAGTGYCCERVQALLPQATLLAVDLAEPMLQLVRQRHLRCEAAPWQLLCADAQDLPLQSQSCALAVSSLAIQWCDEPKRVFAELARVVHPEGIALLSTLGPRTLQELRAASAVSGVPIAHHQFATVNQLQQAAHAAGWQLQLQSELQLRHYSALADLLQELRGLGANTAAHAVHPLLTRADYRRLADAFATGITPHGIGVSWEVFYLRLSRS